MNEQTTENGRVSDNLNSLVGHPRTDEVAALDDKIALYIHACEMEQALRGVMAAIEQNKDYWEPNAEPPFYPDAHVHVTLKASECEAVFASLPNDKMTLKKGAKND